MKTNFFHIIGECESNMHKEDVGINEDRIFLLVQNKILLSKKQRKKKIYLTVSALICSASMVTFVLLNLSDIKTKVDENGDRVAKYQEINKCPKTTNDYLQKPVQIKVCVYESTQEGQFLTQNYANEMKKKELKLNEKVVIGSYNPLDSSVPGYPIFISDERDSSKKYDVISLKVSAGNLIQWDKKTGDIITIGKEYQFSKDANIYWSPLENGKTVEKTIISAGITDGLSQNDTITVTINRENDVFIAKKIGG